MVRNDPFKPARRVAGQKQDVWYTHTNTLLCTGTLGTDGLCRTIVNEAATASPVQPIVNMGQGFL